MHSPMQSFGESRMHPSTPCSASAEFGGRRSTVWAEPFVVRRRRAGYFKSGFSAFGSIITIRVWGSAAARLPTAGFTIGIHANFVVQLLHLNLLLEAGRQPNPRL